MKTPTMILMVRARLGRDLGRVVRTDPAQRNGRQTIRTGGPPACLDQEAGGKDTLELYRTLGLIEQVLLSRSYEFINLSLGPDLGKV